MFKRHIKSDLKKALLRSPVVILNGARQVGKSTLALEIQLEDPQYTYLTLDDDIVYLAAKTDPMGFIAGLQKPAIIDEVQRVPEIFRAIKRDVDLHRKPGRYLLTGSANPLLIPKLGDSLAGRMEVINLMPLSQGEILGIEEQFIDRLFNKQLVNAPLLTKEQLYDKALVGGYPSIQNTTQETRQRWMQAYINSVLYRDIKDLAQIEKLTQLPNILKVLATRAGNLLNVAEISRELKMVDKTLHRYIALLETIFLISIQLPWSNNTTTRFIKSPKVYLVDSGLLAFLFNVNEENIAQEDNARGKIIENFVVGELQKQATWSSHWPKLYHYRTSSGDEVDVVLEDKSGKIIGIEVKGSTQVTPNDFKGMRSLQEKAGNKFIMGVVLYAGSQIVPFGETLFAMPISSLWGK